MAKKASWKLKEGATWRSKLEAPHVNHGKEVPVPDRWVKTYGRGTMLIPRPLDVEALMRKPKHGQLLTVSELRAALARDAGANCACPLTTGIFVRIVAETAEEDRSEGAKRITPYWRTIKDDGKLNEKYPGGVRAQAAALRAEGFTISAGKGKQPPRVKDFESSLVRLG